MKISEKQINILSGLCILTGLIIVLITRKYNTENPDNPNLYGKWIGIAFAVIGMIFLTPWQGKKKQQ